MHDEQTHDEPNVEFIRLLFRSPREEEIAYEWAARLAEVIGAQVMQLRPSTTLAEIEQWMEDCGADVEEFMKFYEWRQGMEDELDYPDQTFRELIQRLAERAS